MFLSECHFSSAGNSVVCAIASIRTLGPQRTINFRVYLEAETTSLAAVTSFRNDCNYWSGRNTLGCIPEEGLYSRLPFVQSLNVVPSIDNTCSLQTDMCISHTTSCNYPRGMQWELWWNGRVWYLSPRSSGNLRLSPLYHVAPGSRGTVGLFRFGKDCDVPSREQRRVSTGILPGNTW